jgi:predicted phage replisome organizer
MGKEKRYYWLKLKEGFFNQKEIKKLRKIAGGDTYTIIYLKMQLKSLATNGSLFHEGYEDEFASELALEIDEDPENIKITLLYLEKHNLIEKMENKYADEFILPIVRELTGSETATAGRVRRHRAKKALPCNNEVTPAKQNVTRVKQSGNGEIEKELDVNIDIEKDIPVIPEDFYKDNHDDILNQQDDNTTNTEEKQKVEDLLGKEKEKNCAKKEKERIAEKDLEEIYKTYPTQCFNGGGSTNRSCFDKEKLKKLIRVRGKGEIVEIIKMELEDRKKSGRYLRNFKTLVNNFPNKEDFGVIQPTRATGTLTEQQKQEFAKGIVG